MTCDRDTLVRWDREHLWHPFTQMQGFLDGRTPDHHPGRRELPLRSGRQPLPGRGLLPLGQPSRPPAPGVGPGLEEPTGAGGPQHPPGTGPPPGHPAGPAPGPPGPGRPHQGLFLRRRLHRGGGGPEAGFPVLAKPGKPGEAAVLEVGATATTATPWERWRWGASRCSMKSTIPCCSTPCRPPPLTATAAPTGRTAGSSAWRPWKPRWPRITGNWPRSSWSR